MKFLLSILLIVLCRASSAAVFPSVNSVPMYSTNLWWWVSSVGINCNDSGVQGVGEGVSVMTSPDGLVWTRLVNGITYHEPDAYTNNCKGPIAREFALNFDNGKWWALSNFDPYNDGTNAQGSGAYYSYDLTNWTRQAVLYFQGRTNATAHMFAGAWFTDRDGEVYYLYSYAVGALAAPKQLFITKRLDGTYTNWSASTLILNNTADKEKWDGSIIWANNQYQLYSICNDGLGIQKFTNNTLTSEFTVDASFRQGGLIEYDGESPMVFRINSTTVRMYTSPGRSLNYVESTDDGITWPEVENVVASAGTNYFSPGMFKLSTPSIQPVIHTGHGYPSIATDSDLKVSGGLTASKYLGVFKVTTNGPGLNYKPPVIGSVVNFTNGNYRATIYGTFQFNLTTATVDNGARIAKLLDDGTWQDVFIGGFPAIAAASLRDAGKATTSFSVTLGPNQPYRLYREASENGVTLTRWIVEVW